MLALKLKEDQGYFGITQADATGACLGDNKGWRCFLVHTFSNLC
jgi:hypothetical protein